KVATYALIARLAGNPRAPRMVGWLLHTCTQKHQLPWQRVIKSDGTLPFAEFSENGIRHKQLLKMEGVVVLNHRVDLKKYLWHFRENVS
ncbi:MAG: MGMT family protein, partial [Myxococcaceae bacterium]|nr:MGMT family protein [Myxococcaceae bacterium]